MFKGGWSEALREWNDTSTDLPETTVPKLFERIADERPNSAAVEVGDEVSSYAGLKLRANKPWLTAAGEFGEVIGACLNTLVVRWRELPAASALG